MVLGKVAFCLRVYLLYTLMIYQSIYILHDARSGCFIGHQCINHVMYADDICLLALSALGLQKLLEMCYGFSQDDDIIFIFLKSVYVVF